MSIFWIDYETRSRVDIRVVGAHRYAKHPSTEVMCMAYAVDEGEVKLWLPGQPQPEEMVQAIEEGWEIHAHNAQFERLITQHCMSRYGWTPVAFEQWRCTAAKAAHANQPRSLDGVTARLLPQELHKDKEGHKIMLKLSKPNRKGEFIYPEDEESIELYQRLYAYCKQDVRVERAIDARLPRWPDSEIKVWQLNEKINDRGVPIDRPLCEGAVKILNDTLGNLADKINLLTGGVITAGTQVQRIKKFVNERGVNTDSLDALNIQEILSGEVSEEVRDVLQLRQSVSGAAAKKYQTALDMTLPEDPYAYGMFMYYGAATGRFAGRGLQVQNFKHGADKSGVFRGCVVAQDIELLKFMFGPDLITTLGKNVRGCIRAPKGYVLVRCDSSQVECRICHWLAGNEKKLAMFRHKVDPYIELAKKVYKKDVKKGDQERQVCKHAELGLQFGQGAKRFKAQVYEQTEGGIRLTEQFSKYVVDMYREDNPAITKFWGDLDEAVVRAVTRSEQVRVGKLILGCIGESSNRYLVVRLPTGRHLFYPQPEIIKEQRGYKFLYSGPNGPRTEWGGGLLTNNCTQATARDTLVFYMQSAADRGLDIIMQVHDEIIVLAKEEEAERVEAELVDCFKQRLPWMGDDLPLDQEAKTWVHYSG